MKNIKNKLFNIKSYAIVAFFIVISILLTSYAWFTLEVSGVNNYSIKVVDLKANVTSTDLIDKKIVIAPNEEKEIEVELSNNNNIDAKFNFFYSSTSIDAIAAYKNDLDLPPGEEGEVIEKGISKTYNLVITNKSNAEQTITFDSLVGFTHNPLSLPENNLELNEYVNTPMNYTVNSVNEMIEKTNLKEGDIVTTISYHLDKNRGGAKYDILSTTTESVDNVNVFQLDNGLYAKFSDTSGSLTIDHYGLHGDGINNDSDIINKAIVDGISINLVKDDYVLESPINIDNINNVNFTLNNSNIIISDKFNSDNSIINISNSSNIVIDGISTVIASGNSKEYNSILNISNSNNININNSNIENFKSKELFEFTNSSNISFSNNTIVHEYNKNTTVFNDSTSLVSNNTINITSSNDSTISLFNNVNTITNNNITSNNKLDTIFNYENTTLTNAVSITGNTLNINYDEINNNTSSELIKINNTSLNNFVVDISNNTVTGENINNKSYLLMYNSIDSSTQTINMNNNSFGNYHKRYVIGADVVNLSYVPKVDNNVTSVESMKSTSNLLDGDIVKTTGFYEGKTTGSSYYVIVNNSVLAEDGFEVINLDNGKKAIMYTTGLPVSVNQFGGYGDGVTGDVDSINAAINSGYKDIYLETGNYVIDKSLQIQNVSGFTFDGRNNLMLMDNSVNITGTTLAIRLSNSSFIDFVNLKLHNFATDFHYAQFGILRSGNISINDSEFYVAPGVESTNLDLWSDWENIDIKNNDFINESDVWQGGNLWVRDSQVGSGACTNADITGNYFYKQSHDEMLAVYDGDIHDVYIANNEFISEEGVNSTTSIMNFSLGSRSNTSLSGVVFESNEMTIQASMGAIFGDVATDTIIRNNKINFTKVDDSAIGYIIDGNSDNDGVAGSFGVVENNEITINADSDNHTLYVTNNADLLKNNTITTNNKITTVFSKINELDTNTVHINGRADKVFNSINHAINNNVTINNKAGIIFEIGSLTKPVLYEDNIINYNYDEALIANETYTLVSLNNINLNSHTLTFNNNTLNHPNVNIKSIFMYANLKDTTEQNIYFNNNNFAGGYSDKRIYPAEYRDLFNVHIVE